MRALLGFVLLLPILAVNGIAADSWTPIYDGKDMQGWKHVGPGGFKLEDGLLKTEGGMGLLYYTKRQFGDGDKVRVVFKTTSEKSNSGIYIRFPDQPLDPWYAVHNGYEVQIDGAGDEWHCTGAIYSLSKVAARKQKAPGEWNTMEIAFQGPRTVVTLNGEKVNDFDMNSQVPPRHQWFEPIRGPRANRGFIGIQNHDEKSTVYFKEVTVSGK